MTAVQISGGSAGRREAAEAEEDDATSIEEAPSDGMTESMILSDAGDTRSSQLSISKIQSPSTTKTDSSFAMGILAQLRGLGYASIRRICSLCIVA
jgi:hypothetical protein